MSFQDDDSMDQGEGDAEPKMSRLEMMIDSLQSRLGLGRYSSAKVEQKPKQGKKNTLHFIDPEAIHQNVV